MNNNYTQEDILKLIKNPNAVRNYAHFDYRTSFSSKVDSITNPNFVSHYSFYPLIEKELRRIKHKNGTKVKDPRRVSYSAHLDRCIYQYYSFLLNEKYNKLACSNEFNNSAIAYRTNLKGYSNCSFAQRAFSSMRTLKNCYVLISDFKHFFETLDHKYLKQELSKLFIDKLIPNDHYRVFKSATKYSLWDIQDLLAFHDLPYSKTGIKRLNQRKKVLTANDFKSLVKHSIKQPWKDKGLAGIPQGLPISGILANIYMIDFDTIMTAFAKELNGLYMRYSDDLILICPTEQSLLDGKLLITKLCGNTIPNLTIHPDKTHLYRVQNNKVFLLAENLESKKQSQISYLGFSFDGAIVKLRQQTIGRYYRKTYRAIKKLYGKKYPPSKNRVNALYIRYSSWGKNPSSNIKVRQSAGISNRHGNFLTYVERAQAAFPEDPISIDTKHHKRRIRQKAQAARAKIDNNKTSK